MMESLINIFSELEDPRDNRGKKHLLIHVIVLAIYGMLCGFSDFSNMAYFLKKKEKELTAEFGLLNGIPSHDAFSAVFRVIDPQRFMELFIEWTKTLIANKEYSNKHIAIDGKAIKSATDKVNNGNIPYIVSGFLCDVGISIGQVKVDGKSNEITAIPELLDIINIENHTVTIDAIGTQKEIVDKIVDSHGNYCLSVKENQRTLFNDIDNYFKAYINDSEELKRIKTYETIEKDHGRVEKRQYYISDNLFFISNKDKWKDLSAIGMVIQEREERNVKSTETHYYILNKYVDASKFANYVRNHWAIENSLHWVLDVIFDEDHSTARKDKAIENISIIRKLAFNLTKLDPEMKNKSTKKKIIDYQYDLEAFKRLIYETIPNNC